MGLFNKKENSGQDSVEDDNVSGKYNEACSLCGKSPTDKKWGGQYFHKKCFRKMKKMGKGMI
jgi:hypothetical protein